MNTNTSSSFSPRSGLNIIQRLSLALVMSVIMIGCSAEKKKQDDAAANARIDEMVRDLERAAAAPSRQQEQQTPQQRAFSDEVRRQVRMEEGRDTAADRADEVNRRLLGR